MAITVTNKTYGVITTESADWGTPTTLVTVGATENLHIKTIKVVDTGGDGGEVRIIANNGTTDYYLDAFTVIGGDSLDCSPLVPYAIESSWVLKVQAKGGAGIHITVTGVLQGVVA